MARYDEQAGERNRRDRNERYSYGQQDQFADQSDDQFGESRSRGMNYGDNDRYSQSYQRDDDDYYASDRSNRFSQGGYSSGNRNQGGFGGNRSRGGMDFDNDYDNRSQRNNGGSSYGSGGYGSSDYGSRQENQWGRDRDNDRNRSYYGDSDVGYGSRSDYRNDSRRGYGDRDRGFFDKAGDEVASWFGDEDAERRRRQDHSGRGPANYQRSNERLLEDACERLTHSRRLDASGITVTADNNEITLDGTVTSRSAKREAEDCVHDISGVKHVQNNLRVDRDMNRSDSGSDSVRSYDSDLTTS